jgi:hypothetical protein
MLRRYLMALEGRNSQTGDTVTCPKRAHPIRRRRLDAHSLDRSSDALCEVGPHLRNVRRKPWSFRNNRCVDVPHRVATGLHAPKGFPEEQETRYILVLRIVCPKAGADIAGARRAKDGVDDRMGQGIRIRVALKAFLEWNLHPTQDEASTGY